MKWIIGLCALFIGVSIFIIGEAFQLEIGKINLPLAGFFPLIASIGMILTSVIILFQSLYNRNSIRITFGEDWWKIVILSVTIFLYGYFIEQIGFFILTTGCLLVFFRIFEPIQWKITIPMSFGSAYLAYAIFNYTLGVELPRGIIPYGFLKIFY